MDTMIFTILYCYGFVYVSLAVHDVLNLVSLWRLADQRTRYLLVDRLISQLVVALFWPLQVLGNLVSWLVPFAWGYLKHLFGY